MYINPQREIINAKKAIPHPTKDKVIKFILQKFKKEQYLSNKELRELEDALWERLNVNID